MEAEARPYGVILEVVYYDRTKDIVFPEQNNAIEWLTRLKQEDNIERVNIRNATDEECLNHFCIVQSFKDALQSFDNPIDERLLNLDFTV